MSVSGSPNFSFLQARWPDLAILASFAETYVYTDPASSLVKLRIFAETMVDVLYYELGIPKPSEAANFRELLNVNDFRRAIPKQIIDFLHYIRKEGNKGAHEAAISLKSATVLQLLRNVHQLSVWFVGTITQTPISAEEFQAPSKPLSAEALLAELKAREAKIEALEKAQEQQRSEHPRVQATETALQQTLQQAIKQAETMGLTEAQTRKQLIDSFLVDAGWVLLDKQSQYNTESGKPQAIREYPVLHQSTKSGQGYIDYVLMGKNGLPIAVIEAKKTAENGEKGRTQAEEYANGIEQTTGQRPFIYYTNGHDIHFWDDSNYPPRRVWGFFNSDKLEYLLFQRAQRKPLATVQLNPAIAGRSYQLECVRRVYEDFETTRRKALVVMATGTGKTRTAMSLIDGLMRANWVKRVLFLVDRVELQNQAEDAFKEYLPDTTIVKVSSATKKNQDARVYLATYNAMMNAYGGFNVGFFDLVIADESHRSIYKYYREIFQYFDAFQIGLTATPVDYVSKNTYQFFNRESQDPTFYFSLSEAISHQPPYLVNYQVNNETTEFLQRGIQYDQLGDEQKAQLEEQDEEPQSFNYTKEQMDKAVLNKETNRKILRNLMDNGIRNSDGTRPGKTIIFARNHQHGLLLESLFNEMYEQYKGKIARLIDYKDPRAQELIKGFKGKKKEFKGLDIAISVDMLDTGIDVREVVNLVFAKPVYSKVKFWQMIGRGTRLCENLFGPGKDKTHFVIFDPWHNFEFFGENPEGFVRDADAKSVPERLFSVRLALLNSVTTLLNQPMNAQSIPLEIDPDFEARLLGIVRADIGALPTQSVTVREKWQEMERVRKESFWEKWNDESHTFLAEHIQPLMRWRNIEGDDAKAMAFDIKIIRLQLALVQGNTDTFTTVQDKVLEDVERLSTNLNQVKVELELIQAVQKANWWQDVNLEKLEDMRLRLRGLMKYRSLTRTRVKSVDIEDYAIPGTHTNADSTETMEAYRQRLVLALQELVSSNLTLQKIRRGLPVTETDIVSLQSLILERVPGLKPESLNELFPDKAHSLDKLIRSLLGMDELTVHLAFDAFRQAHTTLTGNQVQFLTLVEQEIIRSGGLEPARLYEQPFTNIHTQGIDGVFEEPQADELIRIIKHLVG